MSWGAGIAHLNAQGLDMEDSEEDEDFQAGAEESDDDEDMSDVGSEGDEDGAPAASAVRVHAKCA